MQDEPPEDCDEEPYDELPLARLGVRMELSERQLATVLTEVAHMIHNDPSCLALDGENDIEIACNFSPRAVGFGTLAYELGNVKALRQLMLNHDAEDAAVAMKRAAAAAAAATAAAAARCKAKLLAQIARSPIEPPSAEQLRDDDARCAQLAIDATVCETLPQQAVVPVPATQTRRVVAALAASVSARSVHAALRAAGVPKQHAAAALLERAHDGAGLLRDLAIADYAFGGVPTPALSSAAATHAARTFDALTYVTYTEVYVQAPPRSLLILLSVDTLTSGKRTRMTRPSVVEASNPVRRAVLVDRLELLAPIVARLHAMRRAEGLATDPAVPRLSARRAVLSARAALRRLELPPAQNPNLTRPPVKDPTMLSGVGAAGLRVLIAVRRSCVVVPASKREDCRALATVLLDDVTAKLMIRTAEETFFDGTKGAAAPEAAAVKEEQQVGPSKVMHVGDRRVRAVLKAAAAVNDSADREFIRVVVVVHDLRPKRVHQFIGEEPCEEWQTAWRIHDAAGIDVAYPRKQSD
ncbi:hypothetical protein T492DRAFT_860306 [Pavlovales sp. CCMP2436]|nr:hypothetical protein T492DRAFT_860306 [Pavlovales sp. CCMP2436]